MFYQSKKIIFGMLAFCAVAMVQAQIVFPVEAPKLALNDTWSYQLTDLFKNEANPNLDKSTVTRADNKGYRFSTEHRDGVANGYEAGLNLLTASYSIEGEEQQNKWIEFPLNENSKWSNKYRTVTNETIRTYTMDCEVNSTEKVSVPAGNFDTVKYTCKGFWNNTARTNRSFEQITWYSPAVKRVVKREIREWNSRNLVINSRNELKQYKLN